MSLGAASLSPEAEKKVLVPIADGMLLSCSSCDEVIDQDLKK